MPNDIVVFDKPYSSDKIVEARAIQWAVVSGACNKCKCLKQCESNRNFKFPPKAPCMIKKAEVLRRVNNA